jgi:membrane protein YqaA with SNARE-associated domain
MLFFGVLGSSLGGIVNWYCGTIIISTRSLYHKLKNEYTASKTVRNLLIRAAVLFACIPALESVIQVLSGYLKLNLYAFISLTISSSFFYFVYSIITVQMVNWCLSTIIISTRNLHYKLENEHITLKIVKNLLIYAVALLSWVPALGSVIQILSGCFKLNLYILAPLIIPSNFFYLLYLILTFGV